MNPAPTAAPARPGLLPLDDALAALLATAQPLNELETLALDEADGRVLAQDLRAALDVPGFDNSAMDGYAVRAAEVAAAHAAGAALPVSLRIPAGAVGAALQAGTVARIFTGAPIPTGADAVLAQEEAEPNTDASGSPQVRFLKPARLGQHIRRRGEDIACGQIVLPAGALLGPAELGLAASLGAAQLPLRRRLRVALLSSGDELIEPGHIAPERLPPGAIYNSNRTFLRALLQRLGCQVSVCAPVPDRLDATVAALREAAQGHDLVLSSGGVSVGEADHLKAAVQALGGLHLWQIAIKPGKPFAHGWLERAAATAGGRCHYIGLPGNPVASYVTFLLLVQPFVRRLQGVQDVSGCASPGLPQTIELPAHFDWPSVERRREFLRVRRNAAGGLDLYPSQGSGVLSSIAWADGLVDKAPGQTIAHGDGVRYWPFGAALG
jgi:molybdopterin molybdotransferase